ncbi:MAG: AMP-binding protein, partial [Bacteriovoracaceae bacterium]|nr:AMP-binding protein [Bacteriovoracaceae bacterium]
SFDLDNVMYVIFTSGSTGRPKGVQTTYRNAMNFLLGMQNEPGIDESHVVLAHTTMCFDISVLEIFLPLINSAKIVLAQKHDSIDGKLLKNLVQANGVNYIQATPATWRLLLSAGFNPDQSLKALCGAEPFPLDLASVLVTKCESVWNMYGPTETTVWCSCHKITSTKPPFLVGRPIENTTFYVLDSNLNPVPMGGVGELFIGGAGVSRGFCNREELTKSLFVPDPFTGEGLMYRSGDLARFNNEGVLECLGRGDGQVKLRGYRIELGEIEYVLQEHNCIEQAVVSLREDRPGDQRLVAYVKFKGPSQEQSKIKKYMGTKLPSYMVPAHIISLDSFPLTLSSKVDRKKLPSPLEIDTGEVLSKKSTKRLKDIQKAPQVKYSAPGLVEIKPYGSKTPVVCFSDLTSELNRYSKISSLIEGHPMFGATVDAFEKGMWPVASLNEYVPGLINSVKAALPSGPYVFVGLNDSAVLADKCAQVFRQFGCIVKVVHVVEDQQDLSSGVVEKFWSTIKLKSIGLRLKLARHLGLPMQNELKSRYLKGVFTKALQRDKMSKDEGEILKIKMDRKSFYESWSMFINE